MSLDLQRAFSWLNQFSASQLQGPAEALIGRLASGQGSGAEQRQMLYSLAYLGAVAESLPVRMEAFAQAGYFAHHLGFFAPAREYFGESLASVPADTLQAASLEWCLGCVLGEQHDPSSAYGHWFQARSILERLIAVEQAKPETADSLVQWYQHVHQDMDQHMAAHPEEAYAQMRPHHGVQRAGLFDLTIQQAAAAISRRDFSLARQTIAQGLVAIQSTATAGESADAHAYAGLAEYEMGDLPGCLLHLETAVARVSPESNESACLDWLRGAACLQAGEESSARANLHRAELNFRLLERRANQTQNSTNRIRYQQIAEWIAVILAPSE